MSLCAVTFRAVDDNVVAMGAGMFCTVRKGAESVDSSLLALEKSMYPEPGAERVTVFGVQGMTIDGASSGHIQVVAADEYAGTAMVDAGVKAGVLE